MKEIYIKRKAKHVCVVCGEKDERTIAGKIRCAKCEKKRKRNVTKVIKKPENKKNSAYAGTYGERQNGGRPGHFIRAFYGK